MKHTVVALELATDVIVEHEEKIDRCYSFIEMLSREIDGLVEENRKLHESIMNMQHGIIRNGYFDIMDAEKEKVSNDPVDGFVNDFVNAAEPLMKYLSENHHPHVTVIVTGNTAEMVEGMLFHKDDKHIVD